MVTYIVYQCDFQSHSGCEFKQIITVGFVTKCHLRRSRQWRRRPPIDNDVGVLFKMTDWLTDCLPGWWHERGCGPAQPSSSSSSETCRAIKTKWTNNGTREWTIITRSLAYRHPAPLAATDSYSYPVSQSVHDHKFQLFVSYTHNRYPANQPPYIKYLWDT